jgi:pimeloyl-ACP methyl ester carboxylesterase
MPVVSANGIEIAYDDRGDPNDPVILLIMGLATQMIAWPEAFCDGRAARGFRVIRFDNRDVGPSTKFESAPAIDLAAIMQSATAGRKISTPYDLTDMAKDAVGLIDRLSIGKAHVVGASMGGMVGHIVAGQYPERVRSLVSVMSSGGEPKLPQAKPEAMSAITQPRRSASTRRSRQAHGRAIPGSKLTIIPGMGHDIPTGLIPNLI